MTGVNLPDNQDKKQILTLAKYLKSAATNSTDTVEAIDELAQYEYITEENHKRMMRNEFIGLMKDLQGYLDIYLAKH
jgi:hypothetical protein